MNHVRAAHAGDEAFVVGLVPRFVEHGVAGGHTRDEVVDGTARQLRRALTQPRDDELFVIAEDARGERAGFLYATSDRDYFTGAPTVHVEEIATVRSGEGTGATLMDAAEAWAASRGASHVTLNVIEHNPASRFYARLGYGLGNLHLVKRLAP